MLKLQSSEPVTVEIGGGANVTLDAPSPRIVAAGRRAARLALNDDIELAGEMASLAFSEGVLRAAIREWKGIGDADGKPLPCNPETVAAALGDPHFFDALERGYVVPIIARETEKNVSAASSAGTSAAATAGNATASSRAGSKPRSRTKKPKTS